MCECVCFCVCVCVYLLHVPVPVCSTASVQCTMVVCEETTPGKLPLDHAVAGAKVPLNTLYYGRLQLHHVVAGPNVKEQQGQGQAGSVHWCVCAHVCDCICACVYECKCV